MQKIVEFEWCQSCEHCNLQDYEDPCNDCLDEPMNEDSRRPVFYKEKEDKKK